MGVRRLTSLVEQHVWSRHAIHDESPPSASVEALPPASIVLLDGNGFIGWVCSHLESWASAPSGPEWMLRGGSYAAVDSLVRAWVRTFAAHGAHTLAVFDSYAGAVEGSAKTSTGDDRLAVRQDNVAECLAYCAAGSSASPATRERLRVQYPCLLGRQVAASLASAGAWLLHAPGEADGLLLRLSHEGRIALPARPGTSPLPPLPVACLLGNDSDFFVTERCRYVPLNWLAAVGAGDGWLRLEVALMSETEPSASETRFPPTLILVGEGSGAAAAAGHDGSLPPPLRLPVIGPADVAAALGLPRRRLLELATLSGNDLDRKSVV